MKNGLVALLATASLFAAAETDSIVAVTAQEEKLYKAMIEKDTRTVAGLLTDDFIRTPPTAPSTNKTEWLALLDSGGVRYLSIKKQDPKYAVFGDTVLVHSFVHVRAHANNSEVDTTLRALLVWVRQNGAWRLAALHANSMPSK
jgi:ketosteroid isomerase-like protein